MESMSINKAIKILHKKQIKLFSVIDAKKLFKIDNNNTLYKLLQRLEKQSIIERITAGKYQFSLIEAFEFELANFIADPSYISLESALSLYGILSQFPYSITSVTINKSQKIIYKEKEYEFNHISPKYFFSFIKKENFLIASPEKALLDELYFISKGIRKINLDELDLSKINKTQLREIAKEYKFIPLKKLLKKLIG